MNAFFQGKPVFGLRGPAGPDGAPVGTIISFMGTTAPSDYLICDGSIYNISDYLELASFFKEQFGSETCFGSEGDGTFAVPDMRNMFLRGYHGKADEQLSGEIGKKQEGTIFPYIYGGNSSFGIKLGNNAINTDTISPNSAYNTAYSDKTGSTQQMPTNYTSRPVNMAVLYCIKAVKSESEKNNGNTYLVKVPVGTIVIWSGTVDNIPTGWRLCDGQEGTPDLRDKFVLCAGETHQIGETDGKEKVALTIEEIPSHDHDINGITWPISPGPGDYHDWTNWGNGANWVNNLYKTEEAGGSQEHENMPPYYALCYIIKIAADETDGEIYSEEEVRIGTWIDGKPLYRKVITNLKAPSTAGSADLVVNVSNVKTIANYRMMFDGTGFNKGLTQNGFFNGSEHCTTVASVKDENSLSFYTTVTSYFVAMPIILVIEYTKTTDDNQPIVASRNHSETLTSDVGTKKSGTLEKDGKQYEYELPDSCFAASSAAGSIASYASIAKGIFGGETK